MAAVDVNRARVEDLLTLPGMGVSRAEAIIRDREQNGPFDGIYDLARVVGVGRRFFVKVTGLSARQRERRDRHELLNELLGLPRDDRPSLAQIAASVTVALSAAGCVLAGRDGIPLAVSAMESTDAERLSALVPRFFRRARRYLRRLSADRIQAVALPMSSPPLLFVQMNEFFMIVVLRPDMEPGAMRKAEAVAREIDWLLSRRAVVVRRPGE